MKVFDGFTFYSWQKSHMLIKNGLNVKLKKGQEKDTATLEHVENSSESTVIEKSSYEKTS